MDEDCLSVRIGSLISSLSMQIQSHHSPSVNNWSFFDESESYWKPASDSNTLYEQLSLRKYREILRKQIEWVSVLIYFAIREWYLTDSICDLYYKSLRATAYLPFPLDNWLAKHSSTVCIISGNFLIGGSVPPVHAHTMKYFVTS